MKNLIEYLKDKIYYVMAGTIVLILLLLILGSCSNNSGTSYEKIESNMKNAAEKYYSSREEKLPKEEGNTVRVTIGTLIESGLLKEIKDPKDKTNICEGYVEVKKVDDTYAYIPFLTCKGNYEPKYLTDVIKNSKLDEYGNGVYEMDGEYVYRGDDVNNYVKFNDQLWRIIKIDKDGDIKLVSNEPTEQEYTWDTAYNADIEKDEETGSGNTTDYFYSNLHKSLISYYKEYFSNASNEYIVKKSYCIGKKDKESVSLQNECSQLTEKQYVGLINASDYINSSLDLKCLNIYSNECQNRNYLNSSIYLNTWLLMTVSENTYEAYTLSSSLSYLITSERYNINPVIYLSGDVLKMDGNGNENTPYILR